MADARGDRGQGAGDAVQGGLPDRAEGDLVPRGTGREAGHRRANWIREVLCVGVLVEVGGVWIFFFFPPEAIECADEGKEESWSRRNPGPPSRSTGWTV